MALRVYKIAEKFPRHEMFGLTSQLKRAVLSIPTNIVEGYARKSKAEFFRFIDITFGFLAETEYRFEFSARLGYVDSDKANGIQDLIEEVRKLLWKFKQSL